MWPCGQTCQECWELEPSAGARIPPLWASLDRKPPEGGFSRHGSPDRRSPGLRHTSEANLLAVAIELLDVVDGATPDEGLGKEHHLAIQPLLIILSWSFLPSSYPVHADICFFSSVKHNAPSSIECSWMQCMNYELLYFLLCLSFARSQGALSLSDTDAMAHLPTDHRANNLVGLDLEHMDTRANIEFSIKTMRFFMFSEWIRAFAGAGVPLFKSPNVVKCLFDRSNHDSTCHILSSHTHITWYII